MTESNEEQVCDSCGDEDPIDWDPITELCGSCYDDLMEDIAGEQR